MGAIHWSVLFLLLNVIVLEIVIWLKRRAAQGPRPSPSPLPAPESGVTEQLPAEHILEWEYEYIRHTASEAMQDRHTMINFYLVLVGVVASGVLANLKDLEREWVGSATLLLWSVCGVGWFHFLILVRLREAWHDSRKAMMQLRDFHVRHVKGFPPDVLMQAFAWRQETLPPAHKPWSVFFYSALLIGLLDSLAFGVGAHLLSVERHSVTVRSSIYLVGLSATLFAYHLRIYSVLLRKKP